MMQSDETNLAKHLLSLSGAEDKILALIHRVNWLARNHCQPYKAFRRLTSSSLGKPLVFGGQLDNVYPVAYCSAGQATESR